MTSAGFSCTPVHVVFGTDNKTIEFTAIMTGYNIDPHAEKPYFKAEFDVIRKTVVVTDTKMESIIHSEGFCIRTTLKLQDLETIEGRIVPYTLSGESTLEIVVCF